LLNSRSIASTVSEKDTLGVASESTPSPAPFCLSTISLVLSPPLSRSLSPASPASPRSSPASSHVSPGSSLSPPPSPHPGARCFEVILGEPGAFSDEQLAASGSFSGGQQVRRQSPPALMANPSRARPPCQKQGI